MLRDVSRDHEAAIADSANRIVSLPACGKSLADRLLLDVPSVPNALLLQWDTSGSTAFVEKDYPGFKELMARATADIGRIAKAHGGTATRHEGDGGWIVFPLQNGGKEEAARHLKGVAVPCAEEIISACDTLRGRYGLGAPHMRVALGAGYVEQGPEQSGPVFWELAKFSDGMARDRSAIALTPAARRMLTGPA
jgi:class 3 adenylate cyclase